MNLTKDLAKLKSIAEKVIAIEVEAAKQSISSIDENFLKAIQLILSCSGKVIITGMGKSGLIGRKISSTLTSTGTPSTFLHPAEAAHGDLGVLDKTDILVAISYSGNSPELNIVIEYADRLGIPIIAFTGNKNSLLSQIAKATINTHVSEEACPLGLAPTASSTKTLILGDALALTVSAAKGFNSDDFHQRHPGGGLGKKLLKVKDLMHSGESLPLLKESADLKTILITMSRGDVRGACGIVNEHHELVGIITDGDLRRRLDWLLEQKAVTARDIMTTHPKTIDVSELAVKALRLMEEFRISVLFVIDMETKKPVGILHIQDLIQSKIK